ncbi:hypothetical protein BBD42_16325 [Paenibacillus sp. BIHB 4019]|uniref:Uncharacterized protein n=1 Tax=Paenibacillus sp. BIHB 4019 TaxID=1870819 RepID=A0A1B2DJG3_9BACL|nr:hypothetical protein [Paenibacillus sp. BIHB 4019]ANY67864.1 hypothetical protein BBD42_16325 [Paenibacillus sp. BIHB 4019]
MSNEENKIPDHHSPLRHILGEAHGIPHQSIDSLETAKNYENAYLVMEGDYGGEIYLVCPVKIIRCSSQTLSRLLEDIDRLYWEDEDGRGIYFELFNIGDIVSGGMGGGVATNRLWVHEELLSIENEISKVIYGKKIRITGKRK